MAKNIDNPRNSCTGLAKLINGILIEQINPWKTRFGQTMIDIAGDLFICKRGKYIGKGDSLFQLAQRFPCQKVTEFRLAKQYYLEQLFRLRFEIGEKP